MKRVLHIIPRCFVLLVAGACSSDGDTNDAGAPIATGGTAASTAGATPGAAGSSSAPLGTAGSTSGAAGARAGTGAGAGASGGTTSAAGTNSAMAGTPAGGAGSGGATAGASGSAAGASGGSPGAAGASGGSAGAAGAPAGMRPPANTLMLPVQMESGMAEPWFNVYRPMDLAATGGPLPVIVWANGGCFRSDFTWAPLFNRWAAGGYVVLALTESPTEGALAQTTDEHQGQLIDWALEQNAKSGGPYAGKLDMTRVVAAGNSCGGITALALAAGDERVKSVFVLSGSSNVGAPNLDVMKAIEVPVGYVVGGSEDIAGANATGDYDALNPGVPGMIVSRKSGDHVTVSTDPMVLDDVADIGLNWIDLTVYGHKGALDSLKAPNVCSVCTAGDWTLTSKGIETLQK